MKVLTIVLIVALTAVCALPVEQQNFDSQQPDVVVTLEDDEDQVDPIEVDVLEELTRDKRQWGGGKEK